MRRWEQAAEPRRNAATRLGLPPPPPTLGSWRPILRKANDERGLGTKPLTEREAKSAIRMYQLLCNVLEAFAVRGTTIDVSAWSAARPIAQERVMLSLHWCTSPKCPRRELGPIAASHASNVNPGTGAFVNALLRLPSADLRERLMQTGTPLLSSSMKVCTDTNRAILWVGLSPKQLTAKRAAKLDPHAH